MVLIFEMSTERKTEPDEQSGYFYVVYVCILATEAIATIFRMHDARTHTHTNTHTHTHR